MVLAPRLSRMLILLAVVGSCLAIGMEIVLAVCFLPPRKAPVIKSPREEAVCELSAPEPTLQPVPQDPPASEARSDVVRLRRKAPALEPDLRPTPVPTEEAEIDPSNPLANVLPTPPTAKGMPVYLGDDLAKVPELKIEAPPAEEVAKQGTLTTEEWTKRKAKQMAVALELNKKKEDGFLEELLHTRSDLTGLPFTMGDACRTRGDRAKYFKDVVESMRLGKELSPPTGSWEQKRQHRQAHVAVLAQVMPEEEADGQKKRIQTLASLDGPEATRELARAAVYSADWSVRAEALARLAHRRPSESKEVLVAGLRYPWPAVAKNAARAIVALKRKDLIPQLEAMLDEPDPRAPRTEKDGKKEVTVVREVVRINHHRNCLLCHAPAEKGKTPEETLVAQVPLPSIPLAPGYSGEKEKPSPQVAALLVRIDVTYLRQDFSVVQPVFDSSVWRVHQRFDFVVRKRVLTTDEANQLRKRLDGENPYHSVASQALRDLK